MAKKKKTKKFQWPTKHVAFTLGVFCVTMIGVWFYYRSRKQAQTQLTHYHNTSTQADCWNGKSDIRYQIKPYSKKGNNHKTKAAYTWDNKHQRIKIKRTTTKDGREHQDYFVIKDLVAEDAQAVYKVMSQSQETHFKSQDGKVVYIDTYENYGQSAERAEEAIERRQVTDPDYVIKGVFSSKDNTAGSFKFIGLVGVEKHERDEDKEKGVLNIFYSFGSPEVTGVQGAASPATYGFIGWVFYHRNPPKLILEIHDTNQRSKKVAENLHFTAHGTGTKHNRIEDESQKKVHMCAYTLTKAAWEEKYEGHE